jgi:single-strand DNA-binding protein
MSRDVASVTIVGRAGTHPQVSLGPTGERVTFRVVATERRFDKAADNWVDGDEFGVAVVCWRTMATSVLTTIRRGDPVVVVGRIVTRRFEKNGATQYFTEVKADCVGLDVARVNTRFTRNPYDPRPASEDAGGSESVVTNASSPGSVSDAPGEDAGEQSVSADGQPLEPDDGGDPWNTDRDHLNGHAGSLLSVD